ncbi:sensor histidine kinase [Actinoplanes sp. HUAS TT8]|uniref:sensor histidine kinase n=1 Tax=Actinoplanes sp. HUAS TT8 TaxID=3447453 RepID=UPI003F52584F
MPRPVASTLRRQFAWLLLVLLVAGGLQLVAGQETMSRYQGEFTRIRVAELANQQVLQMLTDAETGVRGYQLTRDSRFLEPYRSGVAGLPSAQQDAAAAARGDTRRLLADQQVAAQAWLSGYAQQIVDSVPDGRDAAAAVGKKLFDSVREANAAVADALQADERRAAAHFRELAWWYQAGIGVLSLLAVGLALLTAVRTSRLLLVPLRVMGGVLQRLAGGDRAARAPSVGPAEVRQFTDTLNGALDAADRAEADLARRRDYVEQVLDTLGIAVVSCDADGVLVFRNRVARDASAAGTPRHVDDLAGLHEGDPRHPLARALAGEVFTHREMTLHRPERCGRAVMVDACPLVGADGTTIGAVASGYDVTVLREREAELATFAGVVAHDLKAPLAGVRGYAGLLAEEFAPGEEPDLDEVRTLCRRIERSIDRMGQLIDDLLAYATARDKPLHPEAIDLNTMVAQISGDRVAVAPLRPVIEIDPMPTVYADPVMIRQLLDNLIGNAIKYTGPGAPARVHVWAVTDGEVLRLHVDDRGIGIPADQQADVFTAFHRAHAGQSFAGTGLGLAICERVVTRHHGTIAARSNPAGSGTRIVVTLPSRPPATGADTSLFAPSAFATSTN